MNRMTLGLVAILVVAVAAAAVVVTRGGDDGGSSDEAAVRQVTSSAASGSCAAEVKSKLFSPDAAIEIESVNVTDESNATAIVKEANGNTSTVFLVRQSGVWRIRSVTPA